MPPSAAIPSVAPAATRPSYRRLPGRVTRLGGSFVRRTSALWLGRDELVQIDTVFWTEKTRRFAYADIQAVLLRETSRGLILSVVFGSIAAVFGLLAWGMENAGAQGFFAAVAGSFGVLLLYNVARGGTCICTLLTALGPHALPSLNRRRPARIALRLIAARVEERQRAEG